MPAYFHNVVPLEPMATRKYNSLSVDDVPYVDDNGGLDNQDEWTDFCCETSDVMRCSWEEPAGPF